MLPAEIIAKIMTMYKYCIMLYFETGDLYTIKIFKNSIRYKIAEFCGFCGKDSFIFTECILQQKYF